MQRSENFPRQLKRDIGLKFLTWLDSLLLKIGVTFAFFHIVQSSSASCRNG